MEQRSIWNKNTENASVSPDPRLSGCLQERGRCPRMARPAQLWSSWTTGSLHKQDVELMFSESYEQNSAKVSNQISHEPGRQPWSSWPTVQHVLNVSLRQHTWNERVVASAKPEDIQSNSSVWIRLGLGWCRETAKAQDCESQEQGLRTSVKN